MDPVTSAKLILAFKSLLLLGFFALVFWYGYRRFFWQYLDARKLFWVFSAIFFPLIIAKFLIGVFYKGYIPELLFFYAIPSPKLSGIGWFLLAIGTVALFLYFRKKIEQLPTPKFLCSLFLVFFIFSVSVTGTREGMKSVADPFTRTYWEYTGFLPQIESASDFLRSYVDTISDPALSVARHATTHPPGYTLVLYFLHKLFGAGFLGLALFIIAFGALSLIPIFHFWRQFLPELSARRALMLFGFMPGFVMMTATSMEGFLIFVTWCSLALCLFGWQRNIFLSVLGGATAAYGLFSNYLFLLLAPLFAFLAWQTFRGVPQEGRGEVGPRMGVSLATFVLFFAFVQWWSGYSITENFFAAQANSYAVAGSTYESFRTFITFFFINSTDFLIYLGLPFVILFFRTLPDSLSTAHAFFKFGLALIVFFLFLPIFQGNIGRLWLFIIPLFLGFGNMILKEEQQGLFGPLLSLTAFQIIIIQGVFYTFF